MATNPTLRFHQNIKDGSISLKQRDTLDGIMLIPGVPAARIAEQREKFVIRPDDVFIATFSKCGTTWTQQIVKLIVHNGVETGVDVDVFIPWHEHMSFDEIESMPSPRFFKSHLPYQLMPGGGDPEKTKAKYIYVIRNLKDVSVSMYNHRKWMMPPQLLPTWEEHFFAFAKGQTPYGAIYDHFLGWWAHRSAPNILILTFEQMKRDPRTAVVDKIVIDTSFDKMKDNKAANKDFGEQVMLGQGPFMRKGIIGNWRNILTAEQSAEIDDIVAEKFAGSGLVFDYGDD